MLYPLIPYPHFNGKEMQWHLALTEHLALSSVVWLTCLMGNRAISPKISFTLQNVTKSLSLWHGLTIPPNCLSFFRLFKEPSGNMLTSRSSKKDLLYMVPPRYYARASIDFACSQPSKDSNRNISWVVLPERLKRWCWSSVCLCPRKSEPSSSLQALISYWNLWIFFSCFHLIIRGYSYERHWCGL